MEVGQIGDRPVPGAHEIAYNESMTKKFYTGIGSRETPDIVLGQMTHLATVLDSRGWLLRSGGAPGADDAFERGAPVGRRRIYVPYLGFNGRKHTDCIDPMKQLPSVYQRAVEIARRHHPYWHGLSDPVKKLMARNVFQVLGDDLETPSSFVWCWAPNPQTKEGKVVDVKGGTGLAVRVAAEFGVAVYHLGMANHVRAMRAYLDQITPQEQTSTPEIQRNPVRLRLRFGETKSG